MENKNHPLVSVVIPTYKRASVVTKAMESALGQDYSPIEIVVANGGSPDNTKEVVGDFIKRHPDANIAYFETKENIGLSASRNLGIKNAKGQFIALLDDDDEFLPRYVSEAVRAFHLLGSEYGAIGTGMVLIDPYGRESYAQPPSAPFWNCPIGNGSILRREVFFEKNIWFDPNFWAYEDWDFSLRFFQCFKVFVIAKPLRRYYMTLPKLGQKRASLSANHDQSYRGAVLLLQKNEAIFRAAGEEALAAAYFNGGLNAGRSGKMSIARDYLYRSWRTWSSWKTFFYWLSALAGYYGFISFDAFKQRVMRHYKLFAS